MQCDTAQAAIHDLQAVLRLVDAGKVAVSDKTRLPSAATMKAIAPFLLGGDYYDDTELKAQKQSNYYDPVGYIKPFAWPLLIQAGGLAELKGKKLQLSKAGQKALTQPAEKTLRTLWKKWISNKLLDEFRRIDAIKGQTGKGGRTLTAVTGRRQVIQTALSECPVDQWLLVDEFWRYMVAAGHDFEVSRNPWNLYICDSHYGSLGYEGYGGWNILQARYGMCLLFEYAATLGLIDIVYAPPHEARSDYRDMWGTDDLAFLSRYDGLLSFRLNPLGAYCLNLTTEYQAPVQNVQPILQIHPSLELTATGASISPADAMLLEVYAEKLSDTVWRLDQPRILAAIEQGQGVNDLKEFLQSRSGGTLPAPVEQFLADIAKRGQALQDRGTARVIECVDEQLAALIANDAQTQRYCGVMGDRYLVIPTESESKFRAALKNLGYSIAQK
ncbi:MAG: hypothetical protein F6K19_43570 [Cyanothece sp. SIO1E1]|nr:hypothetical protein [Cyanothece sp. SIO1E1]